MSKVQRETQAFPVVARRGCGFSCKRDTSRHLYRREGILGWVLEILEGIWRSTGAGSSDGRSSWSIGVGWENMGQSEHKKHKWPHVERKDDRKDIMLSFQHHLSILSTFRTSTDQRLRLYCEEFEVLSQEG
jgi:hypothetical protein